MVNLNMLLPDEIHQKLKLKAIKENKTLKQAAIELGFVTAEQFDQWVRPEDMTGSLR